jgi:hypothetical protein
MFMLTEETSVCSCLTSSSLISSGIGSKGRSNEFKYFKIRCHFVGDLLDVSRSYFYNIQGRSAGDFQTKSSTQTHLTDGILNELIAGLPPDAYRRRSDYYEPTNLSGLTPGGHS